MTAIEQKTNARRNRTASPLLLPYGAPIKMSLRAKALLVGGLLCFCLVYGAACAILIPALMFPLFLPLIVLSLIGIWALPGSAPPPEKVLVGLFFAFFVGLIAWPNYLAIAIPGLPWITVIRLVGFPLVLVFLICLSVSDQVRHAIGSGLRGLPRAAPLILSFVAIQAASMAFSTEKGISAEKFMIDQVTWTAVFFISVYVFSSEGRATRVAALLWILAIVVCAVGLQEHRHDRVPWVGHIPSFLKIQADLLQTILQGQMRAYSGRYRVQSTFSTSIGLAEFLALATPFILYFLVEDFPKKVKAAVLATAPLVAFLIYLTNARTGVVGAGICLFLYPLLWAILELRQKKAPSIRSAVILLAYPACFALFTAATFLVGRLRHVFWGNGTEQASTDARVEQYHLGIPKVLHHPWGYGIGRAAEVLGYRQPGGLLTIDTYYLRVALDYGVLGFLLYYGLFLYAIGLGARDLIRSPPKTREGRLILPVLIALAAFVLIKAFFAQEDNHPLAFMLLGMLAALLYRERLQRGQEPSTSVRS